MEAKVMLYDADNIKVGETFHRRARQLVSQQRAEWLDESHTAIKFAPDTDEWEMDAPAPPPMATPAVESRERGRIYRFAEDRINKKRRFIWHTLGLIPGILALLLLAVSVDNITYYSSHFAENLFYFMLGSWLTAYAIHAVYYYQKYAKGYRPPSKIERRNRMIEEEVTRLQKMGYSD